MTLMEEMMASELETRLRQGEKLNLIDVRERDEWQSGHIEEARNIPLSEFVGRLGELHADGEDEPIYVICRSGGRSAKACDYLAAQGYSVVNIVGGMLSWPGDVVEGD
ncbi:rhodanese-like domain-containing protein [Paenibacillus humicola]|uniref:rhodanese-like domain-containing protein n=1 Tax=Paenibacillus humicola TaxID=3110540 RepID=UPI00237C2370|nr:rhodanese-like domain-containing protein [Paenibacillus humicola]